MALLKKILSSVGIGAAQVDTVIDQDQLYPGKMVTGSIYIRGGDVEQQIDQLYFELCTNYEKTVKNPQNGEEVELKLTASLIHLELAASFVIKPGEQKQLPLSFQLPYTTPLTTLPVRHKNKVWLTTAMDIKNALDPKDKDYLKVQPDTSIQQVLQAFQHLGFSLQEVDCEADEKKRFSGLPFVQEFEFKPTRGEFYRRFSEVEFVYKLNESGVQLFIEVDRRKRGVQGFLSNLFDIDQSARGSLFIANNQLSQSSDLIANYLRSK